MLKKLEIRDTKYSWSMSEGGGFGKNGGQVFPPTNVTHLKNFTALEHLLI